MIIKVGAGVLLYPFILSSLSAETVGVWTIFSTIAVLTTIFDFGFNQSFRRNVAYIFSGVSVFKVQGYEYVETSQSGYVDYGLLKSTIRAMRHFYARIAIVLFALLISIGTIYIHTLLSNYSGDKIEVYASWVIVCAVNCFLLYTMYFESLLIGCGKVKRANQILLFGNLTYLLAAIILLSLGFGLLAVVSSQALSVIVIRIFSYKAFYTLDIKKNLASADDNRRSEVMKAITPNAVKLGFTSLGGFAITRSSTFIGSIYVPLADMASYGISLQIVVLISQIAMVLTRVYQPKIYQWRVERSDAQLKKIYFATSAFLLLVFVVAGVVLVLCGDWMLELVGSNTVLLPSSLLLLLSLQYYLETNHINAAEFLLSKNEVPFFKASLISAAGVVILLYVFEAYARLGVAGMILAPLLVQAAYQNWRWPLMVIRELWSKDAQL